MLKKPSISILLILCGLFIASVASSAADNMNNISVDFKDADLQSVLRVLSVKSGVNIVAASDVSGTITVKLNDVPW